MKQKIGTLQHKQDNQTSLTTQQIEIQSEMQSEIQQLFQSCEGKRADCQMVIADKLL